MKVELNRVDDDFHFKAIGSAGVAVDIDGAESIGGHNSGARPMELMLMSLGACSAIDIIQILKKQKQKIEKFNISVNGERDPDNIPSLFTTIDVHFILTGELEKNKVERAIKLSVEKYCSATAILCKTAKINYTFEING
jgi:putative redox protein